MKILEGVRNDSKSFRSLSAVTIVALSTLYVNSTFAADAGTILTNCRSMNHVAWSEYSRSLIGKPISGTGRLLSIKGQYEEGSIADNVMSFFGREQTYTLHFELGARSVDISGYPKSAVIQMREGARYNYSAARITFIDNLHQINGCLIVEAKKNG